MLSRLIPVALAAVALLCSPVAGNASLLGDSVDVTVIGGLTFGPDTVTVIVGNEIIKDDSTDIGMNFFGQDTGLGFDTFDAASIDIQGYTISIFLDLADEWEGILGAGTPVLNSVIFQFDLLEFSGGLPLASVVLGSDDPYFATAIPGCALSGCIDFDDNTVQIEITSPTATGFTYQAQLAPVPEPGAFVLLGSALALLTLGRRKRS